jgi:hypothetical protein
MDAATEAAHRIVERLRAAFPEDAARADRRVADQGFDAGDAPYAWVEHFSQFTTDAIKGKDFVTAENHLREVSAILAGGNEEIARCIDVAYVESLMWDIRDEKRKAEGWRLVPHNLRGLYVAMWGERPFMKGRP